MTENMQTLPSTSSWLPPALSHRELEGRSRLFGSHGSEISQYPFRSNVRSFFFHPPSGSVSQPRYECAWGCYNGGNSASTVLMIALIRPRQLSEDC